MTLEPDTVFSPADARQLDEKVQKVIEANEQLLASLKAFQEKLKASLLKE